MPPLRRLTSRRRRERRDTQTPGLRAAARARAERRAERRDRAAEARIARLSEEAEVQESVQEVD